MCGPFFSTSLFGTDAHTDGRQRVPQLAPRDAWTPSSGTTCPRHNIKSGTPMGTSGERFLADVRLRDTPRARALNAFNAFD
tara:strand:+ start:1229 stop:1471 length:243 start_codon:yes stop_codon:yes gene_type:complete